MKNEWILTDDSCSQYRKQISDTIFQLIQIDEYLDKSYTIRTSIIDLEDYSDDEIDYYVNPYYSNGLNEMYNEYGDEINSIISECIFESLSNIDCTVFSGYNTYEEAKDFVKEYIEND